MIERFVHEMTGVEKLMGKKFVWRGLVTSFAQNISTIAYAYSLFYGSQLIAAKELHFKNVIKLVKHTHVRITESNYFAYTPVDFVYFTLLG